MAQKLFDDKIGAVSHTAGVIYLAASKLTIGGQQYVTTSNISRTITADVTLAANTLYYIYAVVSGGSTAIRISTNADTLGPSGFSSWKLVGAFYTNGSAAVAGVNPVANLAASAYRSGSTQTIATATATKIQFNSEDFDTNAAFDSTTNYRFTVPAGEGGLYEVGAGIGWGTSTVGERRTDLYKNGSFYCYLAVNSTGGAGYVDSKGTRLIQLVPGDYLEIYGYQASGGNLDIEYGTFRRTYFEIRKIRPM